MTDFPISGVVNVTITRQTLFPSRMGFGTPLIFGQTDPSPIGIAERVRFYASMEEVATDWNPGDEEYKAANACFSQTPRPTRVAIASWYQSDQPAEIRGGASGTFEAFAAVADGEFGIEIDGDPRNIGPIDFTGAVSDMDDVALVIQNWIRAIATGGYTNAVCIYEDGTFLIRSGTDGAASTMEALTAGGAGTDLSDVGYMNARLGVARVTSPGWTADTADPTGDLDDIEAKNDDWYGLIATHDGLTDGQHTDIADWVEARTKLYAAFSADPLVLDPASSNDVASDLKAGGYDRTFLSWHSDVEMYPDASILARMLTVDFNVPNSAATAKFKRLPGVTFVDISSTDLAAIKAKNANVYVQRGGVSMYEEGMMASGEFFDVMHFVDWLADAIAVDVFGALFSAPTKIPYTDQGAAILEDAVRVVLNQGVAAGGLAEDITDDGTYEPAYVLSTVPVLDVPQSQRAQRDGPPITFNGRLAGAIHFQTVSGNVYV